MQLAANELLNHKLTKYLTNNTQQLNEINCTDTANQTNNKKTHKDDSRPTHKSTTAGPRSLLFIRLKAYDTRK